MVKDSVISLVNCVGTDISKEDYAQCLRCDRMLSCLERYSKSLDGLYIEMHSTDGQLSQQKCTSNNI